MSDLPSRISLREVGPRDGLQNEEPVSTDAKVELIDALSKTGVRRIEAVSFVHPKAIPQMADADEVWKRIRRDDSIRYSALVPNLRGAQRALDAGLRALGVTALPTHANFVLINVGDGARVYEALLRQGVIVRPVANYGLPQWLRVTVGLPEENERFLAALAVALST